MPTLDFGEAPKPKEVPTAPTLNSTAVNAATGQTPEIDDSMLSEDEKKLVDTFVDKIDLHNTQGVLEYGAGTQKKMADFSQSTLENVRGKDMGEIGNLLASVVTEVKSFDTEDADSDKGFFANLFKKSSNKITTLKAKYDKAEVSISNISNALESHQVVLLKDVAMLDKMYEMNLNYYKELTMYILAGKKKVAATRTHELADLRAKAAASGLAEDAQAARDLDELCGRFEKKLHDLDLTRTIAMQTAPQIRLIQNNDTQMAEKIQSTIVNTIPLWKNQMVIALGVNHSLQAAQAQREVTDATNELLKKNSEMLKTATIETAKENERGIIDMETLKKTNANLISTLDEVMKIQEEGRQARAQAETELRDMEQELKKKLLSSSSALG